MNQEEQKKAAAKAAINYIQDDMIVGVGTGSTVNYFIDFLGDIQHKISGAVASSQATENRLKSLGIPVFDLNTVPELPIYIDGADAYNPIGQLVKGGGGALTREKILANAAEKFISIVDVSKETKLFGGTPIPIEVIPMARSFVAREITKRKGKPNYRQHFLTDNGNIILDIHHWLISEPVKQEEVLNNIPGVVSNGLFAKRTADILLIGTPKKVLVQNMS